MKKVWFVTGSSRGLGKALAQEILKAGDFLVATSRKVEDLSELKTAFGDQVLTLRLDVANSSQINESIVRTMEVFGRIDVLVNNAGFGITGAAEAFTDEQVTSQLAVNLYGPIAITRAVIPVMRSQKSGRILQISSIGGRAGNAGLSVYQAAKFGLAGFSESLKQELAPLNIQVTSIEPGGFRTDWAGESMSFAPFAEGYDQTVEAIKKFLTSGVFVPMGDPVKAAKAIVQIANVENAPTHLVLGSDAVQVLKKADAARSGEFEKWLPLSLSTDHTDAKNMFETEEGRQFLAGKGIKV